MSNPGPKAAPRTTSSRSTAKGSTTGTSGRRTSSRSAAPIPPETPGVARIIAIANQKGGVGKSTTAVSLGAALADLGYRVLVIDLDPQGNASTGMGIRHEARETTVYHVIVSEAPVIDAIVPTPVERLHALPSTIDLAGAEIELVSQFSRESRLKKALEPVREGVYDFVLLDCPPSLGLLTVNALTAAEELIVPIQCEYYALEGLGQLLRNVSLVQQNINPGLRLSGIVMTMYDPRTKLSEQVVEEVQRFFGDLVYDVIIPRTVRLSEAPGFGQPITVYDPRSKGAQTYRQLAAEVARRPPPDEPMPVFDDLPVVTLPAVEDGVTPAVMDETELETLTIPTVHQLIEEEEAQAEVEASDPEPPPVVEPVASPEVKAAPRPSTRPKAAARPKPAAAPAPAPRHPKPASAPAPASPLDDDDLWEDSDDPPPASGPDPARLAHTQIVPPEHLPERRVVVIDEDAQLRSSSGPPASSTRPPESPPKTMAEIGATLEEDDQPKRRWRLFRKGGE